MNADIPPEVQEALEALRAAARSEDPPPEALRKIGRTLGEVLARPAGVAATEDGTWNVEALTDEEAADLGRMLVRDARDLLIIGAAARELGLSLDETMRRQSEGRLRVWIEDGEVIAEGDMSPEQ